MAKKKSKETADTAQTDPATNTERPVRKGIITRRQALTHRILYGCDPIGYVTGRHRPKQPNQNVRG
ncbi:MAG: hypothetical protein ABI643_00815 [Candidatus Doudnabacteria bacterium]